MTSDSFRNVYMASRMMRMRVILPMVLIFGFIGIYVLPIAFIVTCVRFGIRYLRHNTPRRAVKRSNALDRQLREARDSRDQAIADMRARKMANLRNEVMAGTYGK